ncbi:MAG: FAD-dependent oxidoreductase [Actinomycetota bacterium]
MSERTNGRRSAAGPASTASTADGTSTMIEGVLVVGGGYAGVHAAQAASRAGASVAVLDPTGTYDFVPRLAAVAGGTAPASDASIPLQELVDRVELGSAVRVADGVVETDDGVVYRADAVIVTAGAVSIIPDVPGIERALPLRTAADALALREAIADASSVVVVGGGATGAQLAGAVAARHDASVTMVEAGPSLLAGMGDLGGHAATVLRDAGVEVLLETSVERLDDTGVVVDSGEQIDGLVVWAAGYDARADSLGIDVHDDGRILLDDHLRVAGFERTFAAGDIALHLDADGRPLPMSAQVAVQAGTQAGQNAARSLAGEPLRSSSLAQRGWVLDLGGWRGVAEIGPISISMAPIDRIAPLLHAAIDVKHLFEIGGLRAIAAHWPGAA